VITHLKALMYGTRSQGISHFRLSFNKNFFSNCPDILIIL